MPPQGIFGLALYRFVRDDEAPGDFTAGELGSAVAVKSQVDRKGASGAQDPAGTPLDQDFADQRRLRRPGRGADCHD